MPDLLPDNFFGTQACILITEWEPLAKLIVTHSTPTKDKQVTNFEDLESFDIENLEDITFSTGDELPHILAEKNIKLALQGPFGSMIKEKMAAYAKICRFRLELHLNKEELFKNKRAAQPEQGQISTKKLESLSFTQLDKIQNDLGALAQQNNQEWENFLEEWTSHLLDFFVNAQLVLTEREIKDLKNEDISSELLPRFIDVGMELPQKEYSEISCCDYLYLKSMLTLQSSLSRRHLSHKYTEIQKILEGFKSEFAQMKKEERQLLENQKKQTTAILSSL